MHFSGACLVHRWTLLLDDNRHRGLKLDGAIDQGEICNSLKCENFSKSILEKFDEMPMTLNKKYDGVFQSKYSGMRKWSF